MRPSEQLRFWAHELASMALTGLEFTKDDYDRSARLFGPRRPR